MRLTDGLTGDAVEADRTVEAGGWTRRDWSASVAGSRVRPRLRAAVREALLVAVLFLAYKIGRFAVDSHVPEALANAWSVWDFERQLRLPSEVGLQHLIIGHHALVRVANTYYAYVHFPITAACLIWTYVRRPAQYRWSRRTLACLTAAALVLHVLMPLAPPRMLGTIGMIDTGRVVGPGVYGSPSSDTISNQYAAMPSLHVGWAVAVAVTLIVTHRSRWRWLWLLHPLVTLLVVVATGNHYWLDAIVAVTLLGLVLLLLPRPPRPIGPTIPEYLEAALGPLTDSVARPGAQAWAKTAPAEGAQVDAAPMDAVPVEAVAGSTSWRAVRIPGQRPRAVAGHEQTG